MRLKPARTAVVFYFAAASSMFCIAGCSRVEVAPYNASSYKEGLRFYRPRPYLLVSQLLDSEGKNKGQNIQMIYLPDYNQEYVIRERVFFGTVSMKPTLENGWNLTSLEATADPKTAEIITALVGVARLGAANADIASSQTSVVTNFPPGIYPLIFDPTGVLVSLGRRVEFRAN